DTWISHLGSSENHISHHPSYRAQVLYFEFFFALLRLKLFSVCANFLATVQHWSGTTFSPRRARRSRRFQISVVSSFVVFVLLVVKFDVWLRLHLPYAILLLNPGIPQDRITAQTGSEKVDLQLGGAAWAKVLVIFADIRFARRKRRHDFF